MIKEDVLKEKKLAEFEVRVRKTVEYESSVYVTAETADEAHDMAYDKIIGDETGEVDWTESGNDEYTVDEVVEES
jgi:hypothetical protein